MSTEVNTIYHVCSQEENLAKLNLVLLGNGHPEDGIAFKVLAMAENHKIIKDDIGEIKDSLKKITDNQTQTFAAATMAAHAIEQYKAENDKFEAGKKVIVETISKKTSGWMQFAAVVIAAIMMIFGYMNIKKDSTQLDQKIKTMEKSYVIVPRDSLIKK